MRRTHLTHTHLERQLPYDPDYHGLVDTAYSVEVSVKSSTEKQTVFVITIQVDYTVRQTKEPMGRITAQAESIVAGMEVPRKDGQVDIAKASEELKRVVEGAVGEDIFIPLAALARAAHLPSVLPIPLIFPRAEHKHEREAGPKKTASKRSARGTR